jgi:hypothetical protein
MVLRSVPLLGGLPGCSHRFIEKERQGRNIKEIDYCAFKFDRRSAYTQLNIPKS